MDDEADVRAIREVMRAQFQSLSWGEDKDADWDAFTRAFLPGASLYPSARPVQPQSVGDFIARMKRLRAEGKLVTFEETALGCDVRVFGNVAMAFAGCEMLENGTTITRDVSATLLVRENGQWRIAAQGWDMESEARKVPQDLLAPGPS
jgi:hypothetical protein